MLKFTRPGMGDVEVEALPGTLRTGGGHDDKSESLAPPVRVASASDGSCEVAIDKDSFDVATALSLASPPGPGSTGISGDASSSDALVDLRLDGQSGILCASISWKGSKGDAQ